MTELSKTMTTIVIGMKNYQIRHKNIYMSKNTKLIFLSTLLGKHENAYSISRVWESMAQRDFTGDFILFANLFIFPWEHVHHHGILHESEKKSRKREYVFN